jgi:hypothetical protein
VTDLQDLSRRLFAAADQLWTNTALRGRLTAVSRSPGPGLALNVTGKELRVMPVLALADRYTKAKLLAHV